VGDGKNTEKKTTMMMLRMGAIPENKSGIGFRGYQVWRRRTTIHWRWGRVTVNAYKRDGDVRWAWPPKHDWQTFRNVESALRFREKLIAEKEDRGYAKIRRSH
jgi:hypothetical protein